MARSARRIEAGSGLTEPQVAGVDTARVNVLSRRQLQWAVGPVL